MSRQADAREREVVKISRFKRLFAPILAGGLIDAVDLATFGPIGLSLGLLAGGLVGWWLAPLLGFAQHRRWLGSLLSGLYCMIPFTSLLPLASVTAGLTRLFKGTDAEETSTPPAARGAPDAIDVDFRVVSDDEDSHWPRRSRSDTMAE